MSGVTKTDLKVKVAKPGREWSAPVLKKIGIEEITASGAKSTTADHGGDAMS